MYSNGAFTSSNGVYIYIFQHKYAIDRHHH